MSSPFPANLPDGAVSHTDKYPLSGDGLQQQLDKILQSSPFQDSKSLKRFLRYTVERTLHGEGGQLKEYRLGIEVFNRHSSFDPRLDPVVRMAARRLRTKLREYYDGEGRKDPIRIDVPKGSYAATFTLNGHGDLSGSRPITSAPERSEGPPRNPANGFDVAPIDRTLPSPQNIGRPFLRSFWVGAGTLAALVALSLALGRGVFTPSVQSSAALGEAGRLLIADVTNTTGEPVFDDTLKQAVAVELGQSPLLDILSEARIRSTLKLMSKPADTKITTDVAREVCQRSGSRTYIAGSILSLGTEYVIGLNAVNCQTGDTLAQEQATAENKEHVLKAVDEASTKLRQRLGESLSTIQKFDIPLEQATTPSLEALKAYSLGNTARDRKGDAAALAFFNRAIELDPDFALAYDALGISYSNLDEPGHASENIAKAYVKRDRASERERFEIAADYSQMVTGELEKANEICELWAQAYPRDEYPHDLLGVNYEFLGKYEKAVTEMSEAIRLNPDGVVLRSNLMEAQIALNRLDEAKTTYQLALARNLDHPYLHADRYGIAFLENDTAEMGRQISWAAGQPGGEDLLLSLESDSRAFSGMLRKAREDSRRAIEFATRTGQKETAALWQMNNALREVEFGNLGRARQETRAALSLASTRDVQILAALTLARAGDSAAAQAIADDLAARFPLNLVVNRYWLPTIRAAIEIDRGNAARTLDILSGAGSYEFGYPDPQIGIGRMLYPVYVRGEAYLLLNRGNEAVAEFRKITDNRSLVGNYPLGALAHLGLARGYARALDNSQSRAAYQQFLALWKDADPDIPVLKQARAEYAKLQ
jgi:eukaryotic-like serine/threonine-protein kinase